MGEDWAGVWQLDILLTDDLQDGFPGESLDALGLGGCRSWQVAVAGVGSGSFRRRGGAARLGCALASVGSVEVAGGSAGFAFFDVLFFA